MNTLGLKTPNAADTMFRDLQAQVQQMVQVLDQAHDLREALHEAPALVRRETPVEAFLRCEEYHTVRAADRMARYWKVRRQYLGDERWLRPMTQVSDTL